MAPDPDICSWILEFLLRQPTVEQWLANELLRVLPLPSPLPFRIHKTILLRRLAADLEHPSLRSLHSLELLDDLHYRAAAPSSTSASMSAAYRAVALHCAADALSDGSSTEVLETLCRRVSDLGGAEPAVLDMELVRGLRVDIDAVMNSADAMAALLDRDTRSEAVEAVRAYLREAVEEFGPSFLEMVADVLTANGIKLVESRNEVAAVQEKGLLGNAGGTRDENSGPSGAAMGLCIDNEVDGVEERKQISPAVHQDEDIGGSHYRNSGPFGAALDHCIGSEIDDAVDRRRISLTVCEDVDGSNKRIVNREQDPTTRIESCIEKNDTLATPEVEKVMNAFKSSCHELKMVIEDPLPKAIEVAAEVFGCVQGEMRNNREHEDVQCQEGARILPSTITKEKGTKGNTEQREECNSLALNQKRSTEKQLEGDERNAETNSGHVAETSARLCSISTTDMEENKLSGPPKHNLIDWNPTARTYEWEDDTFPESSSHSSPTKNRLPSPRRSRTSPLKVVQNTKFTRRRKVKRWSVLEEDTLRKAVGKHGMGNWKTILHCYSDIFEERTEVDLKDKWRNMTRH